MYNNFFLLQGNRKSSEIKNFDSSKGEAQSNGDFKNQNSGKSELISSSGVLNELRCYKMTCLCLRYMVLANEKIKQLLEFPPILKVYNHSPLNLLFSCNDEARPEGGHRAETTAALRLANSCITNALH